MIVFLANNHVFDYGVNGMHDTVKALNSNGIKTLGAGDNLEKASQPVVLEKGGRKIIILNYQDSVGFSAYPREELPVAGDNAYGFAPIDSDLEKKQIEEARKNGSDFVSVMFHYGTEYALSPIDSQVQFSHEAIDYGQMLF